jgi:hypothetical protein
MRKSTTRTYWRLETRKPNCQWEDNYITYMVKSEVKPGLASHRAFAVKHGLNWLYRIVRVKITETPEEL